MSDRGIPATYRHMHGFGSHKFSCIISENERYCVKFHFASQQGIKNLSDAEATTVIGNDCESHQRDLLESIDNQNFPKWTLKVQIMPETEAGSVSYNPANVVPGISFSPDKMLQGRLFSYGDAQRYRLGVNHQHIPVNAPRCPVHIYHRDGAMRVDGNFGHTLGYEPNNQGQWAEQPDFSEPPLSLDDAAAHWDHREDEDYFSQPSNLFRLMTLEQQKFLFDNTAHNLTSVPKEIQLRHLRRCYKAAPAYGEGIGQLLEIDVSEFNS